VNGTRFSQPWPSFSPDGRQIAYREGDEDPKKNNLIIQDLSTGKQRVAYQSSDGELYCQYSNKEPKVFCTLTGRDVGSKTDLFSVDDKTGAVEKIASLQGSKGIMGNPNDRGTFYFVDMTDDKRRQITRWDLNTQQEFLVVPGPQVGDRILEVPSFDGRWLLRIVVGEGLSVRPMSGGDWKILVPWVKDLWTDLQTTPDGNWAFYSIYDSTGKPALFRVPTIGGVPQRVGGLPSATLWGELLNLSADGRQILVTKWNDQMDDLWVLENFEPPVKK
jgi:Tol biopolymer transport system component